MRYFAGVDLLRMLCVVADVDAQNAGRITGSAIGMLLILLGVIKCLKIMKRARTSGLCVSALLLFLICWILSTILTLGMNSWHWPLPVVGLIGLIVGGLALVGVILGIVGLAQYNRERFDQGRKQAIWGIVLCSLMLLLFVAGALSGIRGQTMALRSSVAGKREAVTDRNFAITPPGGWVKIDPKALGATAATLGFRRLAPEMYCVIMAEELGDGIPVSKLTDMVKQNMVMLGEVRDQVEEDVTVNDVQFHRIQSSARMKTMNLDLYYEHWLATHRGMFWQVVVWGHVGQEDGVKTAARGFVDKFEVLDRSRRTTSLGTFEDVDLPAYGVKTSLAGKGWNRGGSDMTVNPLFRVTAERLNEAMVVLPLRFPDEAPDLEAIAAGLLGCLEFTYPLKAKATEKPFTSSAGEGIEIVTERVTDQGTFDYILRIVRAEKSAVLIAGWASKEHGDLELVRKSMDAVELSAPAGEIRSLSDPEKTALSTIVNQAGLSYVARKNSAASAKWFRTASELNPAEGQLIANLAYVLGTMGRDEEALALLEKEHGRFPKSFDLQTQRCLLLADKGELEPAHRQFLELIGRGLRDEKRLVEWAGAMMDAQRSDLAEEAILKWNDKQATPATMALQVDVVSGRGDTKRALKLAEELAAKNESSHLLALKFGDLLNETGDHQRAGAVAEKVLASKSEDSDALQVLGWSQMGRKSYSQAKATFEKALKADPQNQQVALAIQRASSALGQGQNSEVKQPLDSVPLPKSLAKELENPSQQGLETEGRPLLVLARSTGYKFEKNKPQRKTVRRSIKVLNQAGVNLVSNLEYPFDPVSERIFVNRLEVRDPEGKVTASGSVDDVFVRDLGGEMASTQKVLTVPVPGVHPGCVIEVEVTTEDKGVSSEFDLARHTFGYRVPCAAEVVYVVGDVRNLATSLTNGSAVKVIKESGLLAWSLKKIQPLPDEPYSLPHEDRVPSIVISSRGPDWQAVGKQYLEDIADKLKPEPAIAELAAKICANLKTEREKIDALSREVQKTVGYKAIEFGVRARTPNKAGDTLRYRYGDCKDHSLLLHQLLREAGILSHLALVNTSERVLPEMPTLDQFNHMVVHVPALGDRWLVDPTAKYMPITSLPMPVMRDTHALIVDPKGSRLVPLSFAPALGTADIACNRTLKPDGNDWQVTETVTCSGYYAAALRGTYDELTPTEQARRAQSLLAGDGSAEVKEFTFENLDALAEPARISMTYVVRDAIKSTDGRLTASLPALWERDYLNMSYLPERKTPFEWRYPIRLKSEVMLQVPKSLTLRNVAKEGSSKGTKWSMQPGRDGAPVAIFEFQAQTGRWEAKEYQEVYAGWTAARRAWDSPVEWQER
jgi:tetratricopeptide (TPR) repeat protein